VQDYRSHADEREVPFTSLLYSNGYEPEELRETPPEGFNDLGLDAVVASLRWLREEFGIEKFWYSPPSRIEDALYRQQVFEDLENKDVLSSLREFEETLREVLALLKQAEDTSGHQREGIFLGAVLLYVAAVQKMLDSLSKLPIKSEGLKGFRKYLEEYTSSEKFSRLKSEAESVSAEISSLSFYMDIKGSTITVYRSSEGEDFEPYIEKLFERFRPSSGGSGVAEPQWRLAYYRGHVENAILDLVSRLYKRQFERLSKFYLENKDFVDPVILRVYREAQFYLSYLDYISPLRKAGLPFTIPKLLEDDGGEEFCHDCFDIVLASKLVKEGKQVVTNDFAFNSNEKVIVVTGPNSGGKTTFARMIGQVYYLAKLGVPVPGRSASLLFVDGIYTHFPRGEDTENMRSKLETDLARIKTILEKATERSVIILNEPLSSTSVYDAARIGKKIIEKVLRIGSRCVYVTFVDELARLERVASYVAQVDPHNPEKRTFKVIRQPASGLTYARLIAKRYRITYEDVVSRVRE